MPPFERSRWPAKETWIWWKFPDRATAGLPHYGLWEIPVPERKREREAKKKQKTITVKK